MRCARRAVLLALVAAAAAACADRSRRNPVREEITVSAASSLVGVLGELAPAYEAANPGVRVRLNLGASSALRVQIERGAGVDLFLAADAASVDSLAARGRIDPRTRRALAGNDLVLVVPVSRGAGASIIRGFADLARPEVRRVALGAPAVPVGEYARQTLGALGLASALAGKTVLGGSAWQVLAYAASGEVDAGVVYRTDAVSEPRVRVVAVAPAGSHASITYWIAATPAGARRAAVLSFAALVLGPAGRAALRRRGFVVSTP